MFCLFPVFQRFLFGQVMSSRGEPGKLRGLSSLGKKRKKNGRVSVDFV